MVAVSLLWRSTLTGPHDMYEAERPPTTSQRGDEGGIHTSRTPYLPATRHETAPTRGGGGGSHTRTVYKKNTTHGAVIAPSKLAHLTKNMLRERSNPQGRGYHFFWHAFTRYDVCMNVSGVTRHGEGGREAGSGEGARQGRRQGGVVQTRQHTRKKKKLQEQQSVPSLSVSQAKKSDTQTTSARQQSAEQVHVTVVTP